MRALLFLSLMAVALVPAAARAGPEDLLASREKFFTPKLGEKVPSDLTFRDDAGRAVKMGDFGRDKPYVLVLAYYRCPMLCTEVLNDLVDGLRKVRKRSVGRDFEVVVVSFDPDEKPELAAAKKAAYVERYGRRGSEGGWHFLTGDKPEIEALKQAVGFAAVWDAARKEYAHARVIYFVTPDGTIARYFLTGYYPPNELDLALIEASQGTIAAPIERILLMCFYYDPSKGRYSVYVLNVVRLAGALTVALLLLFWLWSWRRARRARAAAPAAAGA